MAATMKDIANRTGLGLATISKYLNGGHVLEKNRIAIEKAIEELDFTVNEFARGLKTRKSKIVGVVIPDLNNTFITSIIAVVEDSLRQQGYGVIVCDSRSDEALERESVDFLLSRMVDGLIMVPVSKDGTHVRAAATKIPVLLIDRVIPHLGCPVDMVLVDNFGAALTSTNYLLDRGHRQIGIIVGPENISTSGERLMGYERALKDRGIEPDPNLTIYSDYTTQGGYTGMKQLLKQCPEMTAVFVTNYEMTLGAVLAVNERGISMPQQLSMIGFDNLQLAQVVRPKLTIVAQPLQQIGETAAQMMLERLGGEGAGAGHTVTLPAELEIGQSVSDRNSLKGESPCHIY